MSSPFQDEPIRRFAELFAKAKAAQPRDPEAMVLATVDGSGRPSARVVLLKSFDDRGFVFYTNYESRKGRELLGQRWAALCFYWPSIDQQVRVEGRVETVTPAEADAYFASRARLSQLGAWASQQSRTLDSRESLEARLERYEAEFADREVPRPAHWSGFRVVPDAIEFWLNRANRLHERTVFRRDVGASWQSELLYP
jgi:pyridoxamine 5'-phosphate oxidase